MERAWGRKASLKIIVFSLVHTSWTHCLQAPNLKTVIYQQKISLTNIKIPVYVSISVSETDGFHFKVDLCDWWLLGTGCVYVQVCHAPLRVTCQKSAPLNVAKHAKKSESLNLSWFLSLLQSMQRYSLRFFHKAQTPLDLYACAWSTGQCAPEDLMPKKEIWDYCCTCHPFVLMQTLCFTSLSGPLHGCQSQETPSLESCGCKCVIFPPLFVPRTARLYFST